MNIVAFGQWNLAKSGGKERTEVSPPLEPANPLLISKELLGSQEEPWPEDDSEDRWLSQVEIVTHIGPARRLWMGPQFSFRTFQTLGQSEDDLADMDVTVTTRPQQSEPMQMPGGAHPLQKPPVFIECGSANSFELSPRFANLAIRGSREHVSLDVESELREAMSDTVQKTADDCCDGGGDWCDSADLDDLLAENTDPSYPPTLDQLHTNSSINIYSIENFEHQLHTNSSIN